MLGHLQVITINNIKEKTYMQLISGGPVCGASFWCRTSAWHGDIGLCVETLMWLSLDVFLVLLNGAVLVGVCA
jgi:hypothetical protein